MIPGDASKLTLDQRAFVVGEEGVCPLCGVEVEWSDISTDWYVCFQCLHTLMLDEPQELVRTLRPATRSPFEEDITW